MFHLAELLCRTRPLAFDTRVDFGSAEHYFHFLWGYLLPALCEVLGVASREGQRRWQGYALRSCGPVMDQPLHEVFTGFRVRHRLLPKTAPLFTKGLARGVPRWDVALMRRYLLGEVQSSSDQIATMTAALARYPEWKAELSAPGFEERFRLEIEQVRDCCLRVAEGTALAPELRALAGHYLVLQRSAEPAFYAPGGAAEIGRYGRSRRALGGTSEAVQTLAAAGVPVQLFEPGRHGFFAQARVFAACRGIVAIRGAELANLIWLRPEAKAVVLLPEDMRHFPPPHREIVRLLGLACHDVDAGKGLYPTLQPEMVAPFLT